MSHKRPRKNNGRKMSPPFRLLMGNRAVTAHARASAQMATDYYTPALGAGGPPVLANHMARRSNTSHTTHPPPALPRTVDTYGTAQFKDTHRTNEASPRRGRARPSLARGGERLRRGGARERPAVAL